MNARSRTSNAAAAAAAAILSFLFCNHAPAIGAAPDASTPSAAGPAVSTFVLPRHSPELSFSVTAFAATGQIASYMITNTPIPPGASAAGWAATAPTSITEPEPGVYDYYAWVKDAAHRVSLCAAQTVDVATTRITVGPKDRDFTNFVDAIAAIAAKGNPKGAVIEADGGEYPSWRNQNGYTDSSLKNIIKVVSDNLTIRGVRGRAHLAYKCRGAISTDRWTVPPAGIQHGSIIVQAARNLRLENVEISGACEATRGNGAGLWVEPGGVGTVIRNCYFHHNDNGILTSKIPGARAVVLNSELYMNGSPGPFEEGQNHNLYIGEIDELVFMFNYSHASFRGQLVKSRASRSYILYNKLIDEADSNYPLDLPYGGECYVIGNLVQKSNTARNGVFINYGREVVMDIVYRKGGPEPLKDKMWVTNTRTGKKYQLHYSLNYGATGKWEDRDRANHFNMRITEADAPDFRPGDRLTYGNASSLEAVEAAWAWSSPRREICVCSNTFVNEHAKGYAQYLLRAHIDTKLASCRNNVIVDLHPSYDRFGVRIDASKAISEKPVSEAGDVWLSADPGFADIGKGDYRLVKPAADIVDKAVPPGTVNGMDLRPLYEYVHPCSDRVRPDDGRLDVGAYEFVGAKPADGAEGPSGAGAQ
jgi:hypothetical protein